MTDIKELLKTFNGEIYDLCYKLIEENGNILEVFQYTCENLLTVPEKREIVIEKYFSSSEINEYESVFGDSVNGILNSTIKKCDYGLIQPEGFYSALWQGYCTNFESIKERAFAFYYTLIDSKIPYLYLGKPLNMDNDGFKVLLEKNKQSIKKIEYISKAGLKQKTEKVSLVLHCLDEIEEFESKVVVLACALDILSTKTTPRNFDIDHLIQQIDRRIEELEQE